MLSLKSLKSFEFRSKFFLLFQYIVLLFTETLVVFRFFASQKASSLWAHVERNPGEFSFGPTSGSKCQRESRTVLGIHLEDHPGTRKWLITMVNKSPKDRVVPLPNGLFMAYKRG